MNLVMFITRENSTKEFIFERHELLKKEKPKIV